MRGCDKERKFKAGGGGEKKNRKKTESDPINVEIPGLLAAG